MTLRKGAIIVLSFLAVVAVAVGISSLRDTPPFEVEISPVDPGDMGVEEWLEDFEHLYDFVEGNYPYLRLKERTHGYNWLDLRGDFEERIRAAPDNEGFLRVIVEAVEALQNRHTRVLDPDSVIEYHARFRDFHPMNAVFCDEVAEAAKYWREAYGNIYEERYLNRFEVRIVYDRGDYILTDYYARPLTGMGARVTEVNGTPIDEAVKTCFDGDYLDWDFSREKAYLWKVAPHHFGGGAVFTVADSAGREENVTFHASSGSTGFSPLYPRSAVMFERFEEERAAYLYVGTFQPSTLKPHYDEILDFLVEIEGYDCLIIDIRGNTGGAFQPWVDAIVRPLIREDTLHEYYLAYRTGEYVRWFHEGWLNDRVPVPKEAFEYLPPEALGNDFEIYNFSQTYTPTRETNFEGEIILLTDFAVYSAAEGFTNFCKQAGFATIYGTPSGGDGFFVWPLYCALPNSKIVVTMTSSMSLDCSGRANEEARTLPDVHHEGPFMDLDELIDFVLEEVSGST
jgi:hypothetical protein